MKLDRYLVSSFSILLLMETGYRAQPKSES